MTDVEGIDQVLNIRTEHLGPEQVLVCINVALTSPADLDRVVEVIDACERVVHTLIPNTLTCYVEPDNFDADRVDTSWT